MNRLFSEQAAQELVKNRKKKNLRKLIHLAKQDASGRRVDMNVIIEFLELVEKLPTVIQGYGLKDEYLIKESKISRSTYFRKKEAMKEGEGYFDLEDVVMLAKAINR